MDLKLFVFSIRSDVRSQIFYQQAQAELERKQLIQDNKIILFLNCIFIVS